MSEVARILSAIEDGNPSAAEQLLPLVYEELRELAAAKMAQEKPGQTLQATVLVHEAYLRLVANGDRHWDSRRHFFAVAAEAIQDRLTHPCHIIEATGPSYLLQDVQRRQGRKKSTGRMGEDFFLPVSPKPNYNRILQPRALYLQADERCTFTPAYTPPERRQKAFLQEEESA